jgi:predicted ATPase
MGAAAIPARAGLVCTATTACGYGTGVRRCAAAAADEVHGFPAALTSFIGRAGSVREVAGRYRLGPLTLPGPGDGADPAGCESLMLFADRARRADARFALDEQAGGAAARLVARLDGLPLAIELAAARLEALGVAQLRSRVAGRRLSGIWLTHAAGLNTHRCRQ